MSTRNTTAGLMAAAALGAALILIFIAQRVVIDPGASTALLAAGVASIAVALGLRVRSTLSASGDHRKVELMLLVAYSGVVDALVIYALSTRPGLDLLGLSGASADKAVQLLTVAWLVVLTLSLLSVAFMEATYARMPVAAAIEVRRVKWAAEGGLSLSLALIFAFSVNYTVAKRDVKRDVSYFKTTAASEATQKMVEQLDTPVRAVLFFPSVSEVLQQITPYFEKLAATNDKFSFKFADHALQPEFSRKYRIRDNGHVLLVKGLPAAASLTDTIAMAGSGLSSEQFQLGNNIEKAGNKLKKLDETFQNRFSKLTKAARSLHLTTGHRERSEAGAEGDSAFERLRGMANLLKRFNIKSKSLGMAQGLANEVPEDAGAVAVIGPREPFLPEEVAALLKYVKEGGRLLLMIDPKTDDGLEPLLHGLGLRRGKGIVASERHHMRRTFTAADKKFVITNSYTSHPTVSSCSAHSAEVASLFIEGVSLHRHTTPAKIEGSKLTFPVRTAADAWLDVDGDFKRSKSERMSVKNLTAAITVGTGEKQGRAVVIGDGGFVTDGVIRNNANVLQFVDTVRWLIGEESVSGSLSSEEDVPIQHRKDDDLLWFYATTFGFPLPLLGMGLLVRRRRRRDRG
jgi:hypothetical protein